MEINVNISIGGKTIVEFVNDLQLQKVCVNDYDAEQLRSIVVTLRNCLLYSKGLLHGVADIDKTNRFFHLS